MPRLPRITSRKLLQARLRAGFHIHHQTGSHVDLRHPRKPHLHVVVPNHSGDLAPKTLKSVIAQADLTVEAFIELLEIDQPFGDRKPGGYTCLMARAKSQLYEYTAFFDPNENGGYTVTVPALPGLVTEGKDLKHAREMAKDAIRCYIEGLKKAKEKIPIEKETARFKLSVVA